MSSMARGIVTLLAALVAALACTGSAVARDNPVFTRLSVEQGLSQETVTIIAQDSEGFIWIGTQEGLNRYDGRSFQVFLNDPNDPGSLPHDWVNDVFADDQGTVWVATQGGMARFDPARESFVRYYGPNPARPVLDKGVSVKALFQDDKRNFWIGTESEGIVLVSGEDQTVRRLRQDGSNPGALSSDAIRDIKADVENRVWIATDGGGLSLWDEQSQTFESYRHNPNDPQTLSQDRVRVLFPAPDGTVWAGTYDAGVSVVNPYKRATLRLRHDPEDYFSLASDRVLAIIQDVDGRIWVGTNSGLDVWDPDRRGFLHYPSEAGVSTSLSDDRVTALMQDRGGVLWVGTYSGANTWNARIGSVEHFVRQADAPGSLSDNVITAFAESGNGDVWVATWGGGLNHLAPGQQEFSVYQSGPQADQLSDNRVTSLAVEDANTLWLGTVAGGLNRFDISSQSFQRFQHDPDNPVSISANAITALLMDSRSRLWATTFGGGVNRLNEDGSFTRFRSAPENPQSLSSDRVVAVAENPDNGHIWFGTHDGGVSILDPSASTFNRITAAPTETGGLPSNAVVTIAFSEGFAWLGTRDRGLQRLSLAELRNGRVRVETFGRQSGLPSNAIMGIVRDDSGMLWVSTNKGLSAVDPTGARIRNFGVTHGLQGNDFNSGAYFKAPDGTLYFGGNRGFNRFDPRDLFWSSNSYKPSVVLTSFWKFNERVRLDTAPSKLRSITLDHSDFVVGFEFAALDFTNPAANRYRYRMEGLEDNWNDAGTSNRANYTNLAPGSDYVLRVQASNNDGLWSDQELALSIVVNPPPWRTWWAYLLYGLLAVIIVVIVHRLVVSRTRAQSEQEANERLQMYLHCLDEASDSVAILDPTLDVVYRNRTYERMLHHEGEPKLWLFQSNDESRQALSDVSEQGQWQTTVERTGLPEPQYMDVTLTGVDLEDGQKAGAIIAIARDVTEQKKSERELKRYRDRLEMQVHKRTQELEQEITEHEQTEHQLRVSLHEKELLLKEVHHRVKNNMQVISSLLHLQTESLDQPELTALLTESQSRIRSMALIHESLYQSENLLEIDFNDYLELLTSKLNRIYHTDGDPVLIDIDAAQIGLDIESAVPCGLIVNELVSNAMKHAFADHQGTPHVKVSALRDRGDCVVEVADNGSGFPEGKDFRDMQSMGMEIVCILTQQLGGHIDMTSNGGTRFTIRFPLMDRNTAPARRAPKNTAQQA